MILRWTLRSPKPGFVEIEANHRLLLRRFCPGHATGHVEEVSL